MRKLFVCLIIAFLSFVCFLAKASALEIDQQKVEITASDVYASRYIWRGQDLYGNNDGAHQPSLDIAFPKVLGATDVSFNIWGSFPLVDGHEDAEELDYTLTFSRNCFEEALSIAAGFTYFDFPNTSSTADVSEPWAGITLNSIPGLPIDVALDLFAGYDFKAKSGGPDEGWYYSWGLSTEFPLPESLIFQDGQTLSLGVTNWGNDGVANLEPSFLYATDISLSTSYELASFSVSPSLNYTINHEDSINSGDEELWGSIEVSYAF